jgi:hypothetical protein
MEFLAVLGIAGCDGGACPPGYVCQPTSSTDYEDEACSDCAADYDQEYSQCGSVWNACWSNCWAGCGSDPYMAGFCPTPCCTDRCEERCGEAVEVENQCRDDAGFALQACLGANGC